MYIKINLTEDIPMLAGFIKNLGPEKNFKVLILMDT